MNFSPNYCFVLLEIPAFTSDKHNFHQQSTDLLSQNYNRVKRCGGPFRRLDLFSHKCFFLYAFCMLPSVYLFTFPWDHHSGSRATWGVVEREGDFWGTYLPVVICASLVKNSTFILVWELSLPLNIFSSLEGFHFLPPQSSLNKK